VNQELVREKRQMNFKTKTFGFVAATALTLSAATGAMAVDVGTTAQLNQNGAGQCNVSATSGTVDFGKWDWNGSGYARVSGNAGEGPITFQVTQTKRPKPDVSCNVTVAVSNLIHATATSNVVPGGNVSLTMTSGAETNASPYTVMTPTGAGKSLVLKATLNSVPETLLAGTYNGTVTATASESSN
jgi:hypothetical protein